MIFKNSSQGSFHAQQPRNLLTIIWFLCFTLIGILDHWLWHQLQQRLRGLMSRILLAVFRCHIRVRPVLQKGNGKLGIHVGVFIFIECTFDTKMSWCFFYKVPWIFGRHWSYISNLSVALSNALQNMMPYCFQLSNWFCFQCFPIMKRHTRKTTDINRGFGFSIIPYLYQHICKNKGKP